MQYQHTMPDNPPRSLARLEASVAIQVSGHLQHGCQVGPVEQHLRFCEQRFARCRVFVHTWSHLTPPTPHWSPTPRGPANVSSAACVERVMRTLRPAALVVEEQRACCSDADRVTPNHSRFEANLPLNWGPERHFGWRQNVRALWKANELRRDSGDAFAAVVRLRPDGKDYPTFHSRPEARVAQERLALFWECVALAAAVEQRRRGAGLGIEDGRLAEPLEMDGRLLSCDPKGEI